MFDTLPTPDPANRGAALIQEIDRTITPTPTLWWLGEGGFILRFATITFYIDARLSTPSSPLDPSQIRHADMILATNASALDAETLVPILEKSKNAKIVLPKGTAEAAHAAGIPYARMTTTDADLRVEYFKDNLYGRIYAIPSARPDLSWSATGGYPFLGYLIRFGRWTVYHAGACAPYEGLADRLRPFNVSVALLPVGSGGFSASDAARLARDIEAKWIAPMSCREGEENDFIAHMLGHRPEQPFKVFRLGEKWTVPED